LKYGDITTFKMAVIHHLGFPILKIVAFYREYFWILYQRTKICNNRRICCWIMAKKQHSTPCLRKKQAKLFLL